MTVEQIGGTSYRVTLTVDEDFLKNAFYPVTVDPTLKISDEETYENAIEDIVLFQGKPDACYRSMQYNTVGYADATLLEGRTAFRLKGLYNGTVYSQVNNFNSVKFYVYGYTGAEQSIGLYPIENTNWTENTATWNNIGDYCENSFITASIPTGAFGMFDITELVDEWYEGDLSAEGGFLLISDDPTVPKKIYSSENTANTSRRPYVEVNYFYPTYLSYDSTMYVGESQMISVLASSYAQSVQFTVEAPEERGILDLGDKSYMNPSQVDLPVVAMFPGTVTLTATFELNDGCTESIRCTIHVILEDGVYMLRNQYAPTDNLGTYYLRTNVAANNSNLTVTTYTNTEIDLQRQWHIRHIGEGMYVIRNMADEEFALILKQSETQNRVTLNKLDLDTEASQIPDNAKWYIQSGRLISKAASLCMTLSNGVLNYSNENEYGYYSVGLHSFDNIYFDVWTFTPVETIGLYFTALNSTSRSKTLCKTVNIKEEVITLDDLGYTLSAHSSHGSVDINELNITWATLTPGKVRVTQDGSIILRNSGKAIILIGATIDDVLYKVTVVLEIQKKAIIIVPGLMGSELLEVDEGSTTEVWSTSVLNSDLDIATSLITLRCNDDGSSVNNIIPKTDGFGVNNTYQPLYDALEESYSDTYYIEFFAYDWRLSNQISAEKLDAFIEENNYTDVVLVCHSMGGLVASGYLAMGPSQQSKTETVIMIGSPLLGTPVMPYIWMSEDVSILNSSFDSYLFTALTYFVDPTNLIIGNFSSIYELFPSKKYFDSEYSGSGYLAKEMGVYLNYDATIEHLENRYSHFNISLANHAENFHDTLYYNSSEHITNLVNTYYIAGYHVNTVCVMQYYSIKNLFYIATNEGDGMLPQWSATLCTRYPEKVFYVDGIDHTTLVKNVDVLSFVNQLVRNDTSIKKSDNLIGTEMNWP